MSAYVNMVCDTMKNTLPKAVVHCQVREAKRSLLNQFYAQIGRKEVFRVEIIMCDSLPKKDALYHIA